MQSPISPEARRDTQAPVTSVDLWGPPAGPTEGFVLRAPRKVKHWGALDVIWGFLGLLVSQLALLPILAVLAIREYRIDMGASDAAAQVITHMDKVVMTGTGIVLAMLFQWAALVGVPVWVTRRKGHRSLSKEFGLRFTKTDLPVGFALAAALQLVMLTIGWLLHQTSLDLSGSDNTGMVTDHTGPMLALMALAACLGAPLTEELFFRGLVLRALLRTWAKVDLSPPLPGRTDHLHPAQITDRHRRVGTVMAVAVSSLIFGLMHLQTSTDAAGHAHLGIGAWVVVAQTGLLGLVFAIVAVKTRRIGLTMCTHMFFNTASITMVLLTSR